MPVELTGNNLQDTEILFPHCEYLLVKASNIQKYVSKAINSITNQNVKFQRKFLLDSHHYNLKIKTCHNSQNTSDTVDLNCI